MVIKVIEMTNVEFSVEGSGNCGFLNELFKFCAGCEKHKQVSGNGTLAFALLDNLSTHIPLIFSAVNTDHHVFSMTA